MRKFVRVLVLVATLIGIACFSSFSQAADTPKYAWGDVTINGRTMYIVDGKPYWAAKDGGFYYDTPNDFWPSGFVSGMTKDTSWSSANLGSGALKTTGKLGREYPATAKKGVIYDADGRTPIGTLVGGKVKFWTYGTEMVPNSFQPTSNPTPILAPAPTIASGGSAAKIAGGSSASTAGQGKPISIATGSSTTNGGSSAPKTSAGSASSGSAKGSTPASGAAAPATQGASTPVTQGATVPAAQRTSGPTQGGSSQVAQGQTGSDAPQGLIKGHDGLYYSEISSVNDTKGRAAASLENRMILGTGMTKSEAIRHAGADAVGSADNVFNKAVNSLKSDFEFYDATSGDVFTYVPSEQTWMVSQTEYGGGIDQYVRNSGLSDDQQKLLVSFPATKSTAEIGKEYSNATAQRAQAIEAMWQERLGRVDKKAAVMPEAATDAPKAETTTDAFVAARSQDTAPTNTAAAAPSSTDTSVSTEKTQVKEATGDTRPTGDRDVMSSGVIPTNKTQSEPVGGTGNRTPLETEKPVPGAEETTPAGSANQDTDSLGAPAGGDTGGKRARKTESSEKKQPKEKGNESSAEGDKRGGGSAEQGKGEGGPNQEGSESEKTDGGSGSGDSEAQQPDKQNSPSKEKGNESSAEGDKRGAGSAEQGKGEGGPNQEGSESREAGEEATGGGRGAAAQATGAKVPTQYLSEQINSDNIRMLGFDNVFGEKSIWKMDGDKQPKFDSKTGTIEFTNNTQRQRLSDVHGVTVNEDGKVVSNGDAWGDATVNAMKSLSRWSSDLTNLKNTSQEVRTAQSKVNKLEQAVDKAKSKIKYPGEDGGDSRSKLIEAQKKLDAAEEELNKAQEKQGEAKAKTEQTINAVRDVEKAAKDRANQAVSKAAEGDTSPDTSADGSTSQTGASTPMPEQKKDFETFQANFTKAIEDGDYDAADQYINEAQKNGLINDSEANEMKNATTQAKNAQGLAGKMADEAAANEADPASKVGSVDLTDPIRLVLAILIPTLAEDHLTLRGDINIKAGEIGEAVGAVDSTALGTDQGEDASRATTVVAGAQMVAQLLQAVTVDLSLLSEEVKFDEEKDEEKEETPTYTNVGTTDLTTKKTQQESYRDEINDDSSDEDDEDAEAKKKAEEEEAKRKAEEEEKKQIDEATKKTIETRRAELMKQYVNGAIQIAEGMNAISSDFASRAEVLSDFSEGIQTESAGFGLAQDVGRYVLFETLRGLALSSVQMGVQASRLLFEQEVSDAE